MALNVPVFFTRLGSSIVFVAVMLTGLLWSEWSFLALILLINFLCLKEYFSLMQKIDKESYWPGWLPTVIQLVAAALIAYVVDSHFENSSTLASGISHYITPMWMPLPFIPVLLILISVISKRIFFPAILQSLAGLLYVTMALVFLLEIRLQHRTPWIPLMLIVMIWSNDTMAYLVGSFFGKTPFSSISPKKTWEGTAGGAIITMIAAGLVGYFTHTYRIMDWVMLALCATVAGTLGDLLESKLKRMADVKDSGAIMPGHGGALDRFDSLLVAIPFAFVYVFWFMHYVH